MLKCSRILFQAQKHLAYMYMFWPGNTTATSMYCRKGRANKHGIMYKHVCLLKFRSFGDTNYRVLGVLKHMLPEESPAGGGQLM